MRTGIVLAILQQISLNYEMKFFVFAAFIVFVKSFSTCDGRRDCPKCPTVGMYDKEYNILMQFIL